MKHHTGAVCIFVGEKKFVVDEVFSRTSSRNIGKDSLFITLDIQNKDPAAGMVFGVAPNDGKIMTSHLIQEGLNINKAEFVQIFG